ncbi:hypothetical protein [Mesorhizobium sp.]|uniref:hypothetical protein n=1 Tax=Mesorhizobium sp. TaxID=1871066 RepID=UPI0025C13C5D|nr:hypothetical protein [Mesorhizobium sp.]
MIEDECKARFDIVLGRLATDLSLWAYALVKDSGGQLKLVDPQALAPISAPQQGKAGQIFPWLNEQARQVPAPDRFWSAPPRDVGRTLDVKQAGAAARLRAVQSWNAPVGHVHNLTHIVPMPASWFTPPILPLPSPQPQQDEQLGVVVIPVLGANAPPSLTAWAAGPQANPSTPLLVSFKYPDDKTLPDFTGVASVIGLGNTDGLDPSTVDSGIGAQGYLVVEPDAENVRRLLQWFEGRAASLLAASTALSPRRHEDEERFAAFFGLWFLPKIIPGEPPVTELTFYWDHLIWFAVSRLLAALDAPLTALLKPVLDPKFATRNYQLQLTFDAAGEGPLLAPLVTAIKDQFDELASQGRGPFFSSPETDPGKICAAIRAALRQHCPLIAGAAQSDQRIAAVLRAIFDLPDVPVAPAAISNDRQFLSAMLAAYTTFLTSSGRAKEDARKVSAAAAGYLKAMSGNGFQTLARLVSELEQSLLDEKGAERAIVAILLSAEHDKEALPGLILANLNGTPTSDEQAAAIAAIGNAWTAYRGLLDGPFNGAEAVRQASSDTALKALLTYSIERASKPSRQTPSGYLAGVAKRGAYYERRILGSARTAQCFDPLLLAFIKPPLDLLAGSASAVAFLRGELQDAYREAFAPIDRLFDPNARFIPDSTPQPLPIQIAGHVDGSQIDAFATAFNGIGVAIRRLDGAKDRWAHANLTDLAWQWPSQSKENRHPGPEVTVEAAIHPMLPAISDGRGPMFIDYDGVPFAASVDAVSAVENGNEATDPRRPFYRHDPHVFEKKDDPFAKLPRLAYGRTFESFAFITSNAGAMPLKLQLAAASPWLPAADFDGKDLESKYIGSGDCQRRTAIAQVAVEEAASTRKATRPDGVMPLSDDYLRIVVVAEKSVRGRRDIMRSGDGLGTMEMPAAGQEAVWPLAEIRLRGKPSALRLTYFDRPALGPDDTGTAAVAVDLAGKADGDIGSIEIALAPTQQGKCYLIVRVDGAEKDRNEFPISDNLGWLRLTLETTDSKAASLSFADTAGQKPDNVPAPLCLLAPQGEGWRSCPVERDFTIASPRVGYPDFMRWLSNGDLSKRALPGRDLEDETDAGSKFLAALRLAYDLRHLDDRLAAGLANLPDLAVVAIRFELATTDTLTPDSPSAAATRVRLDQGRSDPQKTILNEFLDKWKWTPPADGTPLEEIVRQLLVKVLQPLDECFRLALSVSAGQTLSIASAVSAVAATIPAGMSARLMLDAEVLAQDFSAQGNYPSVFHPGLGQYATRFAGPDAAAPLAFPAAALRFEVMWDGIGEPSTWADTWIPMAAAAIAARPLQRARRFDLMAAAATTWGSDERRLWRLIGEIDTVTQRWRPTGRPIYHHIDPADYAADQGTARSTAAMQLELRLDRFDRLAQFESDAFFDRSDLDAHTVTQRLLPLPSATVLQEHPWEAPSATYFRHRFTLRSRYAGAIVVPAKRQADAWAPKVQNEPNTAHNRSSHWTARVAVLAELSRVPLPTPQLRALIPLTTSVSGDEAALPAPPVAAILQEPPFARGGLADRIAAEIKSGFGYGFPDDDKQVEILDSRKETGPTPYLEYRAMRPEISRGMALFAEGPMGLTFDNVDAAAPALPNAMINLRPISLADEEPPLEELFLGVSMRRYFHPSWVVGGAFADARNGWIGAEACWWIDLGSPSSWTSDIAIRMRVGGKDEHDLLMLTPQADDPPADANAFAVKVSPVAVDGFGGTKPWVELLRAISMKVGRVSILHQPVAPGRYCSTIFAEPRADTASGRDNAPLALASVEWSPPSTANGRNDGSKERTAAAVEISLSAGATAWETSASQPTMLKWTRTNRDFAMVDVGASKTVAWPKPHRVNVQDLVGALTHDHYQVSLYESRGTQPLWLVASTLRSPLPLHAHRHLAFLSTRYLKEMGRPAEIFCRTALALDVAPYLVRNNGHYKEGSTADPKTLFQPPERALRVVEFETPAQILCNSDDQHMPARYRSAYFDLISTGFNFDTDKAIAADSGLNRSLRFFLRPVGDKDHLAALRDLTISLGQPYKSDTDNSGAKPTEFTISIKPEGANTPVTVGVVMTIDVAKKDKTIGSASVTFWLLRADGSLAKTKPRTIGGDPLVIPESSAETPGLIMKLKTTGGTGEFWADVSLLHSSRPSVPALFDFDWLFSKTSDTDDPVTAVNPDALARMVEAQARIISVSPPIPIVRH